MATSSILGGERPPMDPKGTDEDALGPSDRSDSGSDALGTDERASAGSDLASASNVDILPDRVAVLPDSAAEVSKAVQDPEAASAWELADDTTEDDGEEDDA